MKIQIITDIHMEHGRMDPFDRIVRPVADVLVIAGDVYPINNIDEDTVNGNGFGKFMRYLNDNWKTVIWVPGNHDYKGMMYGDPRMRLMKETYGNVKIVNNATVDVDGVKFLCTTLWTHIPPQYEMKVKNCLNDFREIGNFNPHHYNSLNAVCKEWIRWAVDDTDIRNRKMVVVTHHLPTWNVVSDPYRNDDETYGFANTDLDDLIMNYDIAAWVHGHSHDVREDDLAGTLVIRNPVGYANQYGKVNCNPERTITV